MIEHSKISKLSQKNLIRIENLTVEDIKKGYIVDFDGYQNEIVLFLRKNKKDR